MSEESKKEEVKSESMSEEFEVVLSTKPDDDTYVITSVEELSDKWLQDAISGYDPSNKKYSRYLKDGVSFVNTVTSELLDDLSDSPQSDLNKILKINTIIRKYINKDDIIGKTVESIETNVNTDMKLSYNAKLTSQAKEREQRKVKEFIECFNEQINIEGFIRSTVPTAYAEGNCIFYLRHDDNNNYIVDYYPLGVVEISDYNIGGNPVVLFNIQELKKRLQKIYGSDNKLFFNNIKAEIKANYPKEVYEAYINNKKYAKLNHRYTGVVRIGNLNRKYGLSPIFRSLRPTMMLETFENSDRVNSKAKSKKIIHQKLRKEVLGNNGDKKGFEEMAYAHDNLMRAWAMPTVVVTSPPSVESISYIESKTELTDVNTVNSYRSKVLNTLGIGFLMDTSSQSVSTAHISIEQLLRIINKISEQIEHILQRWYKQILLDNGFDPIYAPKITIIDSEALDFKLRKDLATTLYTLFNGSLETSLAMLGIDINDEKAKRQAENDEKLDEIFFARSTAYTSSGQGTIVNKNDAGRPKSDTPNDKNIYDDEYNKTRE